MLHSDMTEQSERTGCATYCPEDNKLRLYVGRVPRDEYLKLRAEGWTSTPKQDCDFVATWTPSRLDTCLEYAELIEDEDQGLEDRAADRAERFGEYRDKRTSEATGHADRYDVGPAVHGFQSAARGEGAARRHDRIADRSCDAWSNAEYWQRRTAGVIGNALYKSTPGVRMGRIKTIETELRGLLSRWNCPREQITQQSALDWIAHLELRLAYENQMLEAQGGRAAHVEMVPGGFIGQRQIQKVNKSHVTGRVVSVLVRDNHASSVNRWGNPWPDGVAKILSHTIETERLPVNAYRAPTAEELAAFEIAKKARKAAAPTKEVCPLINPTDADAERLQAELNARALSSHCRRHLKAYGKDYADSFKLSTVCRIVQATYSAASSGSYARAETRGLCKGVEIEPQSSNMWSSSAKSEAERRGPALCKIRITQSNGSDYGAKRVIILTDKPQKPLPASVWEKAFEVEAVEV